MSKVQKNIAQWIEQAAERLASSDLQFGHGTTNARDEAAWLVLHAAGQPLDGRFTDWGRVVDESTATEIERLLTERCNSRRPLAYLLGTAWFAGLEFEVGEEVLVPRSPIAELILDGFRPWLNPQGIGRVLDMCTGSACIAIATAHYLPQARVDAADISARALVIANRNIQRHGLEGRVQLYESDLFESLPACRYDLIVANPPYVPTASLETLAPEYRNEPGLGLVSGIDGLDATLSIMVDAPDYLGEDGVLFCEVGESEQRLAAALPQTPFLWLEFEHGGTGVFVMTRQELLQSAGPVKALIRKRKHVT